MCADETKLARINLTLPKEILEEIDKHIVKTYYSKTRTKWFVEAAKDKIEKERKIIIDEVVKGKGSKIK